MLATGHNSPKWHLLPRTVSPAPRARRAAHFAAEVHIPEWLKVGMFVLDFDQTITNKHTRGVIYSETQVTPELLTQNFADLEFFR